MNYKEVKELFNYIDGKLIWKVNYRRGKVGKEVGNLDVKGYRRLTYKKVAYKVHRLVWLWHNGTMPLGEIDHINHDRACNRVENLRDVSRSTNQRNRALGKHGHPGINWNSSTRTWWARIMTDNKRVFLGQYKTKEEAIRSRVEAEVRYGYGAEV